MTKEVKMWELYPNIWKTESAFLSWVRGGIRRSLWNRHPVKLEFIKNNRIRIKNPNPRGKVATVWGGICSLTGGEFVSAELEVDHKSGNHSLRVLENLQAFVEGIILVTEDDLQFVSKEAHRIKSYADKQGITFKEALIEKTAIKIQKDKKDVNFLKERGYVPESNATKRRQQLVEILNKENEL